MKSAIWFVLAVAVPAFGQALKVEKIGGPAGANASQLNWSSAGDGSPLLSWVENDSLEYAVRRGGTWSPARTIVSHRAFFHHPAELPEVISLGGGALMAHWIETPQEGSEAEFVYFSGSTDGVHWTAPAIGHKDRSQVQHGLASMVASGPREASILWLRALKGEDGPVSLMRSVVSVDGRFVREESVDSDVCSCCPTAVVKTAKGIMVAYRDHTPQNIRDSGYVPDSCNRRQRVWRGADDRVSSSAAFATVTGLGGPQKTMVHPTAPHRSNLSETHNQYRDISAIRFENGKWSAAKTIFPDRWEIDACPVNAAAAAALGDKVAVAWYTAAGDKPRVEAAFSGDDGASFGKAVVVSTGEAYGYASVAMDGAGGATVSWLERGGGAARVLVRTVAANGTLGPVTQVATGERAGLGYPRMVRAGNDVLLAWGKGQLARVSK